MHFTIRAMKTEDIPEVQLVAKTSWHHTYEGIIPLHIQTSFLESAYSAAMMKHRLDSSSLFVSEVAGRVVGFANFSPVKVNGEAELGAIYVHPDFQRLGLGAALLQKGISDLEGMKELYINVEKENTKGLNFYQTQGFEQQSQFEENFEGHMLQTVRMVLKLESITFDTKETSS